MQEIYRWVEDIAFYSVLLVLVMHVLPAGEQKKYVRFFMGLLFMLLVFGPILRWTGQEQQVTDLFLRTGYDQELEEFLQEQKRLGSRKWEDRARRGGGSEKWGSRKWEDRARRGGGSEGRKA